ncbi:TM0106 family RecB-like putative nuclease [Prochlorococcus sp. MIT 0602]|uniref:TM0106 family RecB-like putative nuclease n=1 Tax=unclassified Prochlorococcus TaxID=2627481 RepID=UPI0039B4209B
MTFPILGSKTITDRVFCSWIRCKRKAWLDLNQNSKERIWSAHRALQLDHQHKSLSEFLSEKPRRGLSALQEGAAEVIGMRLKGITPLGLDIEAHPPLLKKIKGKSNWGDFLYVPVAIKQGQRLTRENRLSLALWGYLLEQFQKVQVQYGLVISTGKNGLEVQKIAFTKKIKAELFEALKKFQKDLSKEDQPGLTSDRKKCTLCSWKNYCEQKASQEGDLSEVNGIGAKGKNILQEIGIQNLNELASTSEDYLRSKLSAYGTNHENIASQLIRQAKVQRDLSPEKLTPNMVLPELISAKGVLIYDIESDPDARHEFLHGFIFIKRKENGEWSVKDSEYQPILNLNKKSESLAWKKIKNKLNSFSDFPILHYGETELLSISQLGKNQGENVEEVKKIISNFIDIHSRLKEGWLLPVHSYSLKVVAKWLNFNWNQKDANGAQALLWWRQSQKLKAGGEAAKKLKSILRYNHDDCIATWKIAEWIINNN